jgi:two-component system sensor histidine kinase KdpD
VPSPADAARHERVLVCIGASPASERLVHAAHRLAGGMQASWHAVYVDITGAAPLAAEDRDRVEAHLALAESLGGEVARLAGRSVAEAVLAMARERGVTRILAGKPTHGRWRDRLRGSLLDDLIRGSGDIEIHVIAPGGAVPPRAPAGPARLRLASFAPGAVAVAGATALGLAAGNRLALPDDAMLYLFAIMIASLGGPGPGIAAAALAVAAYDFFFIPPHFTFAVYDVQSLMTFAVMFTLGTAMGSLVARLRHAETASRQRERRTQTLLAFTATAARATDVADVAAAVVAHVEDGLAAPAAVLLAAADGTLGPAAGLAPLAPQELEVARSAHAQRRPAGRGTDTLPAARLLAVPLWVGSDGSAGAALVHVDRARRRIDLEGRRLLEAIARQAGGAIARLALAAEARDAEVRARAEELRSSLLSTVSHDLRTPLAIITGTATALRDEAPALTAGQLESLDTIVDEASRLGKILTNLLAITRVESGAELHRDWVPVEELVGAALDRCAAGLAGRDVAIDLAPDIGVEVDPILIEQVLLNLLDNAAVHTPPGTPIELRGFREAGGVALEVSDRGPGLPAGPGDQVFAKFYRGPHARAARPAGAGLGLAVCRGIVNAHGGAIEAGQRPGGGATFHLWLPGGDAPAEPLRPELPEAAPGDRALSGHAAP